MIKQQSMRTMPMQFFCQSVPITMWDKLLSQFRHITQLPILPVILNFCQKTLILVKRQRLGRKKSNVSKSNIRKTINKQTALRSQNYSPRQHWGQQITTHFVCLIVAINNIVTHRKSLPRPFFLRCKDS